MLGEAAGRVFCFGAFEADEAREELRKHGVRINQESVRGSQTLVPGDVILVPGDSARIATRLVFDRKGVSR